MEELSRVTGATVDVLQVLLDGPDPVWGLRIVSTTGRPAGTVYPILARLEAKGWVSSVWDDDATRGPRRRLYRLTPDGMESARALTAETRSGKRVQPRLGLA